MDINNIKPPGDSDPYLSPDEQPVNGKRDSQFTEAASKSEALDPAESASPSLAVIGQFSRKALDDPKKLETMVRASVSELIESNQNVIGPLSDAQKKSLVDFLSEDPLMRRQVETYLRKALV